MELSDVIGRWVWGTGGVGDVYAVEVSGREEGFFLL